MKAHTSEFKNQIKKMGRELDSKIICILDDIEIELGKEQLNSITPTYQGALLKSVMKELDIDSNVYIPVGTILNYQFGVKVNGEYEYINFGNYIVYSVEKQEDTDSYKLICYDKMLYSMIDYEKLNITYPITIKNYINAICNKLGLTFANANDTFANYNRQISSELYLDSSGNSLGYTFRDVLDELAQVTASCICINDNDELEIRYINDTGDTIDEDFLKDINVNFGEKYGAINTIVLSRSADTDNIYFPEVLPENPVEFKISDNQIMNFNDRVDYLPDIYSKLSGLEFYINDFSSTGICYYDLLDRYTIQIGDNYYSCVMLNDEINITQGLEENIYTEKPEETETDYTKADKTDRKINQTYLIVDKQNQTIESVVSQTTEQNQKIATITQTVEELNSKISDIADITTSAEDTDAQIELNEINQSEPIRLVVRPIGENISYLYPNDNLYPSDDLYMPIRVIRFHNNTTDENFDYELPADLLYYDSENYDEFILDYDGQSCVINKRVGYNADGTTYVLDSQTTIEYGYPKIYLTEGDYTVSILGYNSGYIFARLMAKNIYTTQFYTKAETDSIISQTSQSIDLSVNAKLSNYSTTTEMNSAITLKANEINSEVAKKVGNNEIISKINQTAETITIEASKVNIGGVISAINNNTTTTIDGNKIATGTITADQIKSGTITANEVSSSIITTNNLSAQKISCSQLSGGTISGQTISGGTISGSTITATSGTIGGFTIDGSSGFAGSYGTIRPNGNLLLYPGYGSARYVLSNAMTFNAQTGVVIASNSNASVSAPSVNLDLKACSGAEAYLGSMINSDGTGERSGVTCSNGILSFRSTGYCTYNGTTVFGSSSRATKENIVDLTQEQKDEVYDLLKNIPTKQFDYKKEYGKPFNYGFIIEDIEDTKLKDLLHISQAENNKDIKIYSTEDLARLQLIVIQELMKKIESLENKIEEMESENNGEN